MLKLIEKTKIPFREIFLVSGFSALAINAISSYFLSSNLPNYTFQYSPIFLQIPVILTLLQPVLLGYILVSILRKTKK